MAEARLLGFPANLQGTVFDGGLVSGAGFGLADLSTASFAGATAVGTSFQDANLEGAKFPTEKTSLLNADFVGADVSGATFQSADISGAVFDRVLRLWHGLQLGGRHERELQWRAHLRRWRKRLLRLRRRPAADQRGLRRGGAGRQRGRLGRIRLHQRPHERGEVRQRAVRGVQLHRLDADRRLVPGRVSAGRAAGERDDRERQLRLRVAVLRGYERQRLQGGRRREGAVAAGAGCAGELRPRAVLPDDPDRWGVGERDHLPRRRTPGPDGRMQGPLLPQAGRSPAGRGTRTRRARRSRSTPARR